MGEGWCCSSERRLCCSFIEMDNKGQCFCDHHHKNPRERERGEESLVPSPTMSLRCSRSERQVVLQIFLMEVNLSLTYSSLCSADLELFSIFISLNELVGAQSKLKWMKRCLILLISVCHKSSLISIPSRNAKLFLHSVKQETSAMWHTICMCFKFWGNRNYSTSISGHLPKSVKNHCLHTSSSHCWSRFKCCSRPGRDRINHDQFP